jgi:hypothetical protein
MNPRELAIGSENFTRYFIFTSGDKLLLISSFNSHTSLCMIVPVCGNQIYYYTVRNFQHSDSGDLAGSLPVGALFS